MSNQQQKSPGIGGQLARASVWSMAGRVGAKLLDLITLLILAQILTPADFGLVAKAMTVIMIIEAITAMPVDQPILRIKHPEKAVYDTAFTISVIRGVLLFGLVSAVAWPLADYFQEPKLPVLLLVLAVAPVLRGATSPCMSDFTRVYNLRPEATAELLSKLIAFIVVIAVALATSSYWALITGTVTTTIVLFVYTYAAAPYQPALSLRYWRDFADVLGWNSVFQIVQTVVWQVDAIFLGRALETSVFGQYSIARRLSELPEQVFGLPLIRPMMAGFASADDDARRRELWLKFSNAILYIVGAALIVLAILSDVWVYILLGHQWVGAEIFVFGLAFSILPVLPGLPLNALAISMHKSRAIAVRAIAHLIILVPLLIIGLNLHGVIGVIAAKGVTALLMAMVTMIFVRSLLGISFSTQFFAMNRTLVGLVVLAASMVVFKSMLIAPFEGVGRMSMIPFVFATCAASLSVFWGGTWFMWCLQGRPSSVEALIATKISKIVKGWIV